MIQIKPINPSHVSQFVKVHLECWQETYASIYPKEVFEVRERKLKAREDHILSRLGHDSNYFYYGLFDDFSIVGVLIFSIIDDTGILDAIYLKKNYQKKSYGTQLLRKMEQVLSELGITEYYVYVLNLLNSNDFFKKKHGKYLGLDAISIHGKDYQEFEYLVKVGDNFE